MYRQGRDNYCRADFVKERKTTLRSYTPGPVNEFEIVLFVRFTSENVTNYNARASRLCETVLQCAYDILPNA
jgi:hypothetical protein